MNGAMMMASAAEILAAVLVALMFLFEKRLARLERKAVIRLKKYLRRKLYGAR